jgi:hypothetical protein
MITPSFTIAIYIIAHADDWQLFMNPDAFSDINTEGKKVVFIVTTAGDAGKNDTFWRAREEGMKNSIKFCLSPFAPVSCDYYLTRVTDMDFNVCKINNVSSYFLRLPDGGLDGKGFESNDYQSLHKLQTTQIQELVSVDRRLIIKGWQHFTKILASIISAESAGCLGIEIKYLNPKENANPDDHPDHRATGDSLCFLNFECYDQTLFAGYGNTCSESLPANETFWKVGIFAAYDHSVFEACGYSTIGENPDLYAKWCTSKPVAEIIQRS